MSLKQTHYRMTDSVNEINRYLLLKQTHYRVTDSTTRSIIICLCSRLTSSDRLDKELIKNNAFMFFRSWLLHACSRAFSFVPIAFDRTCLLFDDWLNQEINYWLVIVTDSLRVTSSMTRSIVIYLWSRLTILIIQADSFYSASNIQRWTSFSSYLRVFRHIVYVLFFRDI